MGNEFLTKSKSPENENDAILIKCSRDNVEFMRNQKKMS